MCVAAARAAEQARSFETVRVIDVADASTGRALIDAIGRALGVSDPSVDDDDRAARRVGVALDQRDQALLLLDNVDLALPFARDVVAALRAIAPAATFLITSRGRLGLPDEQVLELAPLSVPRADELDGAAARLFLSCVGRVRAGYSPTAAEAPLLAELLRELDGLPLAIVLAAPRLAVMSPAALLHRLRSSRSVLRGRAAASNDKHASFDGAIEASWQALAPHERDALSALSVLAGFTIEDGEAIVPPPAPGAPAAIDTIQALRERSLLTATPDARGELRLGLLRSVADFVRRRSDPTLIEAARARQATRYGELARAICAETSADLDHVDRESDNLLAVARRVLGGRPVSMREAEPALWAMLALAPGSSPRPALAAHAPLLEHVLDATQGSGADPKLFGRVLALRGALRRRAGDLAGASRDLGRALHVARTLGDAELEGGALIESSLVVAASGDLQAAIDQGRRAVTLLAGAGSRAFETRALLTLSDHTTARRDVEAARAITERALSLASALGLRREELRARTRLAELLIDLGERDPARVEITKARALIETTDATALATLGYLEGLCLHEEGDLAGASARYAIATGSLEAARLGALTKLERRAFAEAYAQLAVALSEARPTERAPLEALLHVAARRTSEALQGLEAPAPMIATSTAPLDRALIEACLASDAPDALEVTRARLAPMIATSAVLRAAFRALDGALAQARRSLPPPPEALAVGPRGAWFRAPDGELVSLERRRPLAAILDHLLRARQADPGAACTWEQLVEAAWPGERMMPTAAAHRVRVAVSTLRKLGLRERLMTASEGYLLDPTCPVARVEDAP